MDHDNEVRCTIGTELNIHLSWGIGSARILTCMARLNLGIIRQPGNIVITHLIRELTALYGTGKQVEYGNFFLQFDLYHQKQT